MDVRLNVFFFLRLFFFFETLANAVTDSFACASAVDVTGKAKLLAIIIDKVRVIILFITKLING